MKPELHWLALNANRSMPAHVADEIIRCTAEKSGRPHIAELRCPTATITLGELRKMIEGAALRPAA